MREFTIEEWLTEITGLVSALSASETLLLRRLQQIRLETQARRLGSLPTPTPAESLRFDPRSRQAAVATNPVHAIEERPTERLEPAWPDSPPTSPGYGSSTAQQASHSQENWPEDLGENAVAASSTTRSYDYFSELDEKLAVLQQSGREA